MIDEISRLVARYLKSEGEISLDELNQLSRVEQVKFLRARNGGSVYLLIHVALLLGSDNPVLDGRELCMEFKHLFEVDEGAIARLKEELERPLQECLNEVTPETVRQADVAIHVLRRLNQRETDLRALQ